MPRWSADSLASLAAHRIAHPEAEPCPIASPGTNSNATGQRIMSLP
jgi:hypothetical protein